MWLSDGNRVRPKDNTELAFFFALKSFCSFFQRAFVSGSGGGGIRSGFVDASLTSQSGSRQADTHRRKAAV